MDAALLLPTTASVDTTRPGFRMHKSNREIAAVQGRADVFLSSNMAETGEI